MWPSDDVIINQGATNVSADAHHRAELGSLAAPVFDTIAVAAPPLAECRVAIVTTAGLKPSGEVTYWQVGDSSFTVLDGADRGVQLSHASANFDRVGFAADLNVVYPVDRLRELADGGVIGSVSSVHLSFMGAQMEMETIRFDTGPAAAKVLLDDGVDVVVLTPV